MITYVMLSGGIDSTAALARALHTLSGPCMAVSFDYGQRHLNEIKSAAAIARHFDIPHEVLKIAMPRTLLTDATVPVPDISYDEIEGVSPSYVPFRNGLMLSTLASHIAGRHLDPLKKNDPFFEHDIQIWWGAHAEDAEHWAYPDCTAEFIGAMACAIYIGTYHKVRLVAPFAARMKHEIIQEGQRLAAPFSKTWSCYKGGEAHCGTCATCQARRAAFTKANVSDPTTYLV